MKVRFNVLYLKLGNTFKQLESNYDHNKFCLYFWLETCVHVQLNPHIVPFYMQGKKRVSHYGKKAVILIGM